MSAPSSRSLLEGYERALNVLMFGMIFLGIFGLFLGFIIGRFVR